MALSTLKTYLILPAESQLLIIAIVIERGYRLITLEKHNSTRNNSRENES